MPVYVCVCVSVSFSLFFSRCFSLFIENMCVLVKTLCFRINQTAGNGFSLFSISAESSSKYNLIGFRWLCFEISSCIHIHASIYPFIELLTIHFHVEVFQFFVFILFFYPEVWYAFVFYIPIGFQCIKYLIYIYIVECMLATNFQFNFPKPNDSSPSLSLSLNFSIKTNWRICFRFTHFCWKLN